VRGFFKLLNYVKVKLPAHRAGLPGKETMLTLHPLSPPARWGLRDVLPVITRMIKGLKAESKKGNIC